MPVSILDERTALVVIDLQNGIVAVPTVPHTTREVIDRARALADAFHAHHLPVVLVRVSRSGDGADVAPGRTDVERRPVPGEPGWDRVVDDLAGHPDDIIVTKRSWGAFYGTDLDLQLRRRRITQIVLVGVATSAGVESTARAAHEHGYHVTLATDAMADRDLDSHLHSTAKVFPRIGQTGSTDEIIALLGASG